MGEAGPGRADLHVQGDHVRIRGHPPPDRLDEGSTRPADARSRSRSVRIPTTAGPSVTTTEPICWWSIDQVASVRGAPAEQVTGGEDITIVDCGHGFLNPWSGPGRPGSTPGAASRVRSGLPPV